MVFEGLSQTRDLNRGDEGALVLLGDQERRPLLSDDQTRRRADGAAKLRPLARLSLSHPHRSSVHELNRCHLSRRGGVPCAGKYLTKELGAAADFAWGSCEPEKYKYRCHLAAAGCGRYFYMTSRYTHQHLTHRFSPGSKLFFRDSRRLAHLLEIAPYDSCGMEHAASGSVLRASNSSDASSGLLGPPAGG